ncbi:26S proteasome non-ATPase regulatory subunit 13, partial [Dictyostelium purpureum]
MAQYKPLEYLEHLKKIVPDYVDQINAIRETYDNKLWHQLTKLIEVFVITPQMLEKKELHNFYNNFIKDFEAKLKPLSLVEICIAIARQFDIDESRKFIESISKKVSKDKSAYILSLSYMANSNLRAGTDQLQECKKTLEIAKEELQGITGLDWIVYSSFYRVSTDYYMAKNQASEFYKNALMYLSYCKLETIPQEEQASLAYNLCIAALVGENVYGFGDLIANPILKALEGSQHSWLIAFLKAFNIGDIAQFEQLMSQHRDIISQQTAITNNMQKLRQKISILALLELAFRTPSDQRSISFQKIAQATKLPDTEIEHLLMKSLSLGLIKGSIDQTVQIIHITWVTPRILDLNQINSMNNRITEWFNKTKSSLKIVEDDTVDLVA